MVKMHDTLAVSSYRVFPGMLNAHQTLFSGQIFTWIDDVSSIAAQRLGRRGLATGSLDMVHLAAPVKMGMHWSLGAWSAAWVTVHWKFSFS